MKQNLVVFSPQNRQKTYNLWKKRIYLYMWEVSYTNKRYIYIYTSWIITVIPLSTHKNRGIQHPNPTINRLSWPTRRCHTPLRSKSQSLPDWGNQRGSQDRSTCHRGGGNLWKSTTIKNKGGSFSKDDKNPTKIRVLRKETLSKKWWQRTSRVTFSPVTRDIHLVYAECSLINMHLEDMKSHLIDSTCKKWTRINT